MQISRVYLTLNILNQINEFMQTMFDINNYMTYHSLYYIGSYVYEHTFHLHVNLYNFVCSYVTNYYVYLG